MFFQSLKLYLCSTIAALLALALVFLLCVLAQDANASETTDNATITLSNPLEIQGVIVPNALTSMFSFTLTTPINQVAAEFAKRVAMGIPVIDIAINSPGGVTDKNAMGFIAMMADARSKGIEIRCKVAELAASLAFSIFSNCTQRYATEKATLMWHSARVMVDKGEQITQYDAEALAALLKALNTKLFARLKEIVKDGEYVDLMSRHEVLWPAPVLARRFPSLVQIVN